MSRECLAHLAGELAAIERDGLRKQERLLTTAQDATIRVGSGPELLNFCANNYLGLANHPALLDAAREGLERFGFGMASVRFICGTCLLYTSDAADERSSVALGGRRIIKKKKTNEE